MSLLEKLQEQKVAISQSEDPFKGLLTMEVTEEIIQSNPGKNSTLKLDYNKEDDKMIVVVDGGEKKKKSRKKKSEE